MAEPILLVFAPAVMPVRQLATLCVETARVGAGAVRLPPADEAWLQEARAAITATSSLLVLEPSDEPAELIIEGDPLAALRAVPDLGALVVGGREVSALLAGLAVGAHLRAGSGDARGEVSAREDMQLLARAAALARLAGRTPMTPDEARAYLQR